MAGNKAKSFAGDTATLPLFSNEVLAQNPPSTASLSASRLPSYIKDHRMRLRLSLIHI